jgi:1,4-alpha-glucan branching enzyme
MRKTVFILLSCFLLAGCASRTVELNRAKGILGPNAPVAVEGGVKFSVKAPDATLVTIAGSFNGWNPRTTELAKGTNGVWTIVLPIQPGVKYLYKFVVEGFYFADPDNPDTEPDGFNGVNSVFKLPAKK